MITRLHFLNSVCADISHHLCLCVVRHDDELGGDVILVLIHCVALLMTDKLSPIVALSEIFVVLSAVLKCILMTKYIKTH